jgi:hypothetical protein
MLRSPGILGSRFAIDTSLVLFCKTLAARHRSQDRLTELLGNGSMVSILVVFLVLSDEDAHDRGYEGGEEKRTPLTASLRLIRRHG